MGQKVRPKKSIPRRKEVVDAKEIKANSGRQFFCDHVYVFAETDLITHWSEHELLALSKRIGTVNTGLPEEDVKNHLKQDTCSAINLAEESSSSPQTKDRETKLAPYENFKNEEKIATLDCGHEYRAECLEK
ncbi:hypothetical protein Bca4012_038176 [Brassica carinata]